MAGEIIRLGDPTSHGGTVLEGSLTDICFDKPIAFIGHKTYCPKCKGMFPISEGAMTTTFYGMGVALAGMKTACGATLIATQFTDTVEYGGGAAPQTVSPPAAATPTALAAALGGITAKPPAGDAHHDHKYDLAFRVQDESTGKALAYTRYRITLDDGSELTGITHADGMTEKICSDHPQNATIEVPYYEHDSTAHADHEHYACDC
ncbi:PAAR domain-containing protein [Rugamonas sp. A1-17]|nr:PAAR domain-containing protein [Rugamonas sp. A1-17]